jgi:AraC family transcriptional regulator, regulatory protein of adaptative response / methylated-DNA-[protein]-cysteine methyltransferase
MNPVKRPAVARAKSGAWEQRINQACRLLEQSSASLPQLAQQVGVSAAELQRQFVTHLGVSPKAYRSALQLQRLSRALPTAQSTLDGLLASDWSVASAYAHAVQALGVTPARVRKLTRLGYWVGLSELGWILMAATEKGICWLSFADTPISLLNELRAAYPAAQFYNDEARLYAWFDAVRAELLLPTQALALPLDIQGTAFQTRVWQALRRVPLGKTLSYSGLAQKLSAPSKVRAIANACASNRIGFLIPCHRIIGRDGALTGYRWDVKRKAALLTREGAGLASG